MLRQRLDFVQQITRAHQEISQNPPICPDPHRTKAHIEIGKTDPEETHPGPKHVAAIQASDTGVSAVTGRRLCKLIPKTADQMSQRVATERVAAQQIHIYC